MLERVKEILSAEDRKITESELESMYLYLDMYFDTMSAQEKEFWMEIMEKLDEKFYDD